MDQTNPKCRVEGDDELGDPDVKIILLGDSAVGKSKLVERYMVDEYQPRQLSTFALTLFRKAAELKDGTPVKVDFWDTAGQERFSSMHPSYYFGASACILVFDVTRKSTYQNLSKWYSELRQYCENIPCILVANKIDVDYKVTNKRFKFAENHGLNFKFVSAADGTNVVELFEDMIEAASAFKKKGGDFMTEVLDLLEDYRLPIQRPSTEQSSVIYMKGVRQRASLTLSSRINGAKKLVFSAIITVHECTNIPQSSGKVYCKWKTKPKGKMGGLSPAVQVFATKAKWDYQFTMKPCVMTATSKTNVVNNYIVRLSVRQESTRESNGFVRIGVVTINLAEYVGKSEISRRYLLDDSSFNSTVRVTVKTIQIEGDPMFKGLEVSSSSSSSSSTEASWPLPLRVPVVRKGSHESIDADGPFGHIGSMSDILESRESALDIVDDVLRKSEESRSKHLPSK